MKLNEVLNKIQNQINELAPVLELFVENNIQPSVNDCESLQQQLIKLQERLAIYKYIKQEREISPSFNIHSKISNTEIAPEKKEEPEKISHQNVNESIESNTNIVAEEKTEILNIKRSLSVGMNDKFRFINELFSQNAGEYNIAIEQLENFNSWEETEVYLNSLKPLYEWEENSEILNYFNSLVKKRFL